MTKSRSPMERWIDEILGSSQPPLGPTPAFKPVLTSSELMADRTTHVARQIIAAEKDQRQAQGAWLRQARLEKEARVRAIQASNDPQTQQPGEAD